MCLGHHFSDRYNSIGIILLNLLCIINFYILIHYIDNILKQIYVKLDVYYI